MKSISLNIEISEDSLDILKIKAADSGITVEYYISQLISSLTVDSVSESALQLSLETLRLMRPSWLADDWK